MPAGSVAASIPRTRTEPAVGASIPMRILIVVLFPAPFGPIRLKRGTPGDGERQVIEDRRRAVAPTDADEFDRRSRSKSPGVTAGLPPVEWLARIAPSKSSRIRSGSKTGRRRRGDGLHEGRVDRLLRATGAARPAFGDEHAHPAVRPDHALPVQLLVGPLDRVRVDLQVGREHAQRRQGLPRPVHTGRDRRAEVLDDLQVDGDMTFGLDSSHRFCLSALGTNAVWRQRGWLSSVTIDFGTALNCGYPAQLGQDCQQAGHCMASRVQFQKHHPQFLTAVPGTPYLILDRAAEVGSLWLWLDWPPSFLACLTT